MSTLDRLEVETGFMESDIALAKRVGMSAIDIGQLKRWCWEEHSLIIIRSGKEASRKYFFKSDMGPKPINVKAKTVDGKVEAPGATRRFDAFFSDYDMMSAWTWSDGAHGKRWTNDDDLLYELNMCCASRGMFMHGGNDDYYDGDGNFMGDKTVSWSQPMLVINRFGKAFCLTGKSTLRRFYTCERMHSDIAIKFRAGIKPVLAWPYSGGP